MNVTVEASRSSPQAIWFRRVMWTGIVANFLMSLPCLIDPAGSIALMQMPPATPLMWPRFSAQLVILLTLFYMPAANDPFRYRTNAWLAVFSRLAGVIFFSSLTLFSSERDYWLFGAFDFVFLVPQFLLLRQLLPANGDRRW